MRRKMLGKRPDLIVNRAIDLGAKLYNQCRVAQRDELNRTACVTMLVRGVMRSQFTSPCVVKLSRRPDCGIVADVQHSRYSHRCHLRDRCTYCRSAGRQPARIQ